MPKSCILLIFMRELIVKFSQEWADHVFIITNPCNLEIMNKIILATILSVILLTTPFASVSAQSPEEQKLNEEIAKLKKKIRI